MTTDGSGSATIDFVLPVVLQAGQSVTATATDPGGNTSEISSGLLVKTNPRDGYFGGSTPITLTGQSFASGATVTVGGVAATNVVVVDSHTITATTPALPAGSLNDVTVTSPASGTGTLPNAWISDFTDLGNFAIDIVTLVANRITVGVGGGLYGTTDNIKRQAMAVFILKAEHGASVTRRRRAPGFDVPARRASRHGSRRWRRRDHERMRRRQLLSGSIRVRRDQMAVFLLKGEHGES